VEKKRRAQAKRIQQQHPLAAVEVWGMDEHRLGLKPIMPASLGRIWGAANSQRKLALSMAMVIWFRTPLNRRNILLDSPKS
jgi:hypothetical protein